MDTTAIFGRILRFENIFHYFGGFQKESKRLHFPAKFSNSHLRANSYLKKTRRNSKKQSLLWGNNRTIPLISPYVFADLCLCLSSFMPTIDEKGRHEFSQISDFCGKIRVCWRKIPYLFSSNGDLPTLFLPIFV